MNTISRSMISMNDHAIAFASFGLVVLDEIRFPHQKPLINVLGGSGAYATLGARLFLPSPLSRSLAWPIQVGNDFPDSIAEVLHSWDTELLIDNDPNRPTTRGLLEYRDTTFGPKSFKYTTPVLEIQECKLRGTALLNSRVYHYLTSPQDLKKRISTLLALRNQAGILNRPLIIWESAPLSCKPENLQACLEVAVLVDVVSPNHLELAALFGNPSAAPCRLEVKRLASKLLASGVGPEGKGTVVIRAGENGCLVQSQDTISRWLPPVYTENVGEEQISKVVDPTGAGNAFLGGFAIGYLQTGGNILDAACYGSVAASFALEQVDMSERGNEDDVELWNGGNVFGRLHEYRTRQASV